MMCRKCSTTTEGSVKPDEQEARVSDIYATIGRALEDRSLDLHLFADLTMQWWDSVVDERSGHRPVEFAITHRECRILNFALGEMWRRARWMENQYAADREGGQ
jgi:hypothetical protein